MPKDPKPIQVKIIERRGPSVVVEYGGGLKRSIIPVDALIEDTATEETLALGIPYGLPWETLIKLDATPQKLADHLRANGIWTVDDMDDNPQAVYGAIQAVYGIDFARLIQAAHNYKP